MDTSAYTPSLSTNCILITDVSFVLSIAILPQFLFLEIAKLSWCCSNFFSGQMTKNLAWVKILNFHHFWAMVWEMATYENPVPVFYHPLYLYVIPIYEQVLQLLILARLLHRTGDDMTLQVWTSHSSLRLWVERSYLP